MNKRNDFLMWLHLAAFVLCGFGGVLMFFLRSRIGWLFLIVAVYAFIEFIHEISKDDA